MKIAAVIAEYNPFHNGHKYQLSEIRRKIKPDYVIVLMSGDFTQRGTPAIMDKYTRTRHALENGADMVIELPTMWATASADYFAEGAIRILERLGCISHLAFGCEHEDIEMLTALGSLYAREPEGYRVALRHALREGYSFPAARSAASQLFYMQNKNDFTYLWPNNCSPEQIKSTLEEPNSILAVSYIKHLIKCSSNITPVLIKRQGGAFHQTSPDEKFSSATAVRTEMKRLLKRNLNLMESEMLKTSIPESVFKTLEYYHKEHGFVDTNAFSSELRYMIMRSTEEMLAGYLDGGEDLARRCKNMLNEYENFEKFCEILKAKSFTHTRISRYLNHIVLGITSFLLTEISLQDEAVYARVLGMRKSSDKLLSIIDERADIPVITSVAKSMGQIPFEAQTALDTDIFAANLYTHAQRDVSGAVYIDELSRPLIVVGDEEYKPKEENIYN
ncbi:MAG: nucleotidyltransferase family protein [Eubacterium sp.]|nr:nucleotidyltransferase family protein [Eubacterium sp.]